MVSFTIFCLIAFLSLFWGTLNGEIGRHVSRFMRDPAGVAFTHPTIVAWILLGYIIAATSVAVLAANKNFWGRIQNKWATEKDIIPQSAWVYTFERDLDGKPLPAATVNHVSVTLKSGRIVRGQVQGYTPGIDDNLDKVLILKRPIKSKKPDGEEFKALRGADKIVLHASDIEFFTVLHLDKSGALICGSET